MKTRFYARVPRGIGSEFGLTRPGGYITANTSNPLPSGVCVANGRAALGLVARLIKQNKPSQPIVLLPSYLCYSMIQPFTEAGLTVKFYAVSEQLTICNDAIYSVLDDRVGGIMLMHYFGFPQTNAAEQQLAESHPHITLIDDRTHLLLTDLMAGYEPAKTTHALYSPRKLGPFPDLAWVTGVPGRVSGRDIPFTIQRRLGLLLRTLFFIQPLELWRRSSLRMMSMAEKTVGKRVKLRHSSWLSRWLWRYWDWQQSAHIRQANFRYLLENWPRPDIQPLYTQLPDHVYPLGFPIRTEQRTPLRKHLITRHIYPPIHWLSPDEVSATEFPAATQLATQQLTIPIDQRYNLSHMDQILTAIQDFPA